MEQVRRRLVAGDDLAAPVDLDGHSQQVACPPGRPLKAPPERLGALERGSTSPVLSAARGPGHESIDELPGLGFRKGPISVWEGRQQARPGQVPQARRATEELRFRADTDLVGCIQDAPHEVGAASCQPHDEDVTGRAGGVHDHPCLDLERAHGGTSACGG